MGLKYIYAGFSKCGTKTICAAFQTLGFRVCDYADWLLDTDIFDYFDNKRNPEEKRKLLQKIFENYEVCTDFPGYIIWHELLEAFPDAKVIFWERDADSWYKSLQNQMDEYHRNVIKGTPWWVSEIRANILYPKTYKSLKAVADKTAYFWHARPVKYTNWRGEVDVMDEVIVKRTYRQHCADVKTNCPKDKLLVLDGPNCGWKVLCDFVGVEIPDAPWPNVNRKGALIAKMMTDRNERFPQAIIGEIKQRMRVLGIFMALVMAVYIGISIV